MLGFEALRDRARDRALVLTGSSSSSLQVLNNHPLVTADPALAGDLSGVLVSYLTPGVEQSYSVVVKSYIRFCEARGLCPFPVDSVLLCAWTLRLSTSIKVDSLRMYHSGVRFAHINRGFEWTLQGDERMRRLMRHLKRKYPSDGKGLKVAITFNVLQTILPLLPGWPDLTALSHDDLLFAFASVVAVGAFLRGGEFSYKPRQSRAILPFTSIFPSAAHGGECLVVRIPQTKTQWWRACTDVPVFPHGGESPFNVVSLYTAFCEASPHVAVDGAKVATPVSVSLPAFHHLDGSPMSRDWLVSRTLDLLSRGGVSLVDDRGRSMTVKSASWRAGGVMSAVAANVSESVIMELGRWRSSAWRSYLLHSSWDLRGASDRMWSAASATPPASRLRVGAEVLSTGPQCILEEDNAVIDTLERVSERSVARDRPRRGLPHQGSPPTLTSSRFLRPVLGGWMG